MKVKIEEEVKNKILKWSKMESDLSKWLGCLLCLKHMHVGLSKDQARLGNGKPQPYPCICKPGLGQAKAIGAFDRPTLSRPLSYIIRLQ